jgi:pimeloyl-ACP methyl ester carboxylesterase
VRRLLRAVGVATVAVVASLAGLALHDRSAPPPADWLRSAGLQARFETVGGHRLRYLRSGRGPAVVLVHGFASSLLTWKEVLPELTSDHEVIALDLPGFGLSDQPADLTVDELPASVIGLMDALRVPRAALVGNSLGGAAVAIAAATRPDRVSELVLVDAAGFHMDPQGRPPLVRMTMSPAGAMLAWLPGKRLLVELALRSVLHDRRLVTDERVAEYLQGAMRPGSAAAVRSLGASLEGRYDAVQQALPRVKAPTLVVWGREDGWIPVADAGLFAAAIPRARVQIVEDCGHMPQEEKPAELLAVLRGFLGASAAGAGDAAGGSPVSAP